MTLRTCNNRIFCTHQQPTQMNHSSHSPAHSRPSSLSHTTLSNNYHSNHYGSVKVEDDHYGVSVYSTSSNSVSHKSICSLLTTTIITTTASRITTTIARPFPLLHIRFLRQVTLTAGMRTLIRLSGVDKCTARALTPNLVLLLLL